MEDAQNIQGDLQYVREVLDRAEGRRTPSGIYYVWALITLIGFPLTDFASGQVVGIFWMIAAPVGFILSGLIGWRFSMTLGQVDMKEAQLYWLHWLATLVAMALVSLLVINGIVERQAIGQIILLILALSYFTAGLYQDRPLLWLGLIMCAAYIILAFVTGYVWTIFGVVLAGCLAASGWIGGRRGRS